MNIPGSIAVLLILTGCAGSQDPSPHPLPTSPLQREVAAMDDSLSSSFNAHSLGGLMALFAPDVEFYHDGQGLQRFAEVQAGFAGLFAANNGIVRARVGLMTVYPVPNFGALAIGKHQFCHTERGRQDCGAYNFAMVWRLQADGWKIARVLSYGH